MGLTLTTVVDGTTITAAAVQGYIETIETYLNEGIASADLQATPGWVQSTHVFKPEFFGSPDPRCELVSGDVHWRKYGDSLYTAAAAHYDLAKGAKVFIPGLQVSFKLNVARTVRVLASFAAFEWGGVGTVNEGAAGSGTVGRVADFYVHQDGVLLDATTRRGLFESGQTDPAAPLASTDVIGALVARKQISYAETNFFASAGQHTMGVYAVLKAPVVTGAAADWRHVFVLQRSIVVDYNMI